MAGQFPPPLPGSDPQGSGPGNTPGPASAPQPGQASPPPLIASGYSTGSSAGTMPDPGPMPSPPPLGDPGPLKDPAALHVTEDTRTYPCPSCGGMLGFDPETQGLRCASCGTVVPLSGEVARIAPVAKRDLTQAMNDLARLVEQAPTTLEREVVCQSCGGRTLFTGSFTAVRCPYCNTPIQRDDVQAAKTRFKIDGVLPFQVPEKRAREEIDQWINGRWFAPNEFKKYRELGSFTSIYLAYFDYDAETHTRYTGQRGQNYYVTVGSGDNQRTEMRTNWYPASGVVGNQFADVTGLANTGLDPAKVQELEPWPMELARPYSPEYVAGHLSRTYDTDAGQVFHESVRPRMESIIESTVRQDIGGDQQRISSMDVSWPSLTFSQLALPVWMLTVTYRTRPFQVFINGVTGEVQGQRPYSAVKITAAIIAGIIVIVGIFLLYQMLSGN